MAPEQILGKHLDRRTDLYALGMTAYELIVGEVAFNESDIRTLLRRQLYEETPDVRASVHDCPRDLVEFVRIATAKDPEERFATCREAVNSLHIRRHSEPLGVPNRLKIRLDYGPAQEAVVQDAVAQLKRTLSGEAGVAVSVSEQSEVESLSPNG